MTQLDQVKRLLADSGPMTTRQIGERMGWNGARAASIVSRALSYGYIRKVDEAPSCSPGKGTGTCLVWGAAA